MKYLLMLLTLVLCGFAQAQDAPSGGYGGLLWGTSLSEVKTAVGGKQETMPEGFGVEVTVAGRSAVVAYVFTQDKLTMVLVIFTDEHIDNSRFVIDYQEVSSLLEQRYGAPNEQRWVWLNDLFKDDPQQYGTAVAAEQLLVYENWKTSGTDIEHSLSGKNFKILHKIRYASLEFEGLMEKEKQKQDLGGL